MKTRAIIIILVLVIASSVFFYGAFQINPEKASIGFIKRFFVLENGAVLIESSNRDIALAESSGLYLLACVRLKDRHSFDKAYEFVKKELAGEKGVLCWKVNLRTGQKSSSSASIDNLRIVKALISAADLWEDRYYLDEALKLADAVKENETRDGYLVDFFSWEGEAFRSKIVNISYLDLPTMKRLSAYDPEWGSIYEKCRELMVRAIKEDGLFWERYDIENKQFRYDAGNTINQLLASLHLSEAGLSNTEMAGFLKKSIGEHGKVFNAYDIYGKPINKNESTAVYALASSFFKGSGDKAYSRLFLGKMLAFQVQYSHGRFYGGFGRFGPFESKNFNSFDNLFALFAILENR